MTIKISCICFVCFMSALSALGQVNNTTTNQSKTLKESYKNYFSIGVAVGLKEINGEQADLICRQFSSITAENAMKMGPIHPKEGVYYWRDADSIVNFAQKNNLLVRGHNLCWHEQVPYWIFKDSSGNQVSKQVLLKRLHDHIFEVVKRYKGKIYAWDVVNEAIDDNPGNFLRNSLWYQICGEEFIAKAFEYAHEADPKAILFYNDYNSERPEKAERVYKLLKKLIEAKVPVHAVGLQGHWSLNEPSAAELNQTIKKFASLGLKVQVTELDVSIYPWEKEHRNLRPGEKGKYPPVIEQKHMAKYKEIFEVLRANKKYITGVTFWNLSDRYTWLDEYPVKGRKNFPLLFDANLQPKKAFYEVVNFK
ncbi:1,4-beta-xylanase [Mucilaginibacter sp. HME9299]|uniref:Beta-xylanase n=2 Tax=Mucilaginibacter aquatilis TaxID=1517760 RepID=A0A6I4IG45_9SPHI|nr:1,4-beta-xylanase [Mucilaginibacter aquatilis]